MTIVFAVRATMVDGGEVDLLLFERREAATEHVDYVQANCRLLGFDKVNIVPRRVIGPGEKLDRRAGRKRMMA